MTASLVEYPWNSYGIGGQRERNPVQIDIDMDAKEQADRMAAAEAMSSLSSMILVNPVGEPPASSRKNSDRTTTKLKSENGKANRLNVGVNTAEHENSKSRSRTPRNTVTTRSCVSNKNATSTTKTGATQRNSNLRKSTKKNSNITVCESVQPTQVNIVNSDRDIRMLSLNSSDILGQTPVTNLPSLPSIPSLNLPSFTIPSLGSIPTLGSFTFINDLNSVTVDKQSIQKRNDTPDKFLPFKKRRLVNSEQSGDHEEIPEKESPVGERVKSEVELKPESEDSRPTTSTGTANNSQSVKAETTTFQIKLDPATNFRLFSEIQTALTPDEDGDLPLHIAVVHEHLPMVQKFIQLMRLSRKSVDKFNKDKQTPLHLAVKLNFIDAVKALLEADADVNYVDKTGCTAMHLAVKHQFPECLKTLASCKVESDLNTRNFEGLTPLHTAVERNNMDMVKILLKNNADINMMDGKSGRTALFHAAENDQLQIVEILLEKGANPEVPNYAGITALMAAQARNLTRVSQVLSRASDDTHDEDRSNSMSPARDIISQSADASVPRTGMWRHSIPLRNPATAQRNQSPMAVQQSQPGDSMSPGMRMIQSSPVTTPLHSASVSPERDEQPMES